MAAARVGARAACVAVAALVVVMLAVAATTTVPVKSAHGFDRTAQDASAREFAGPIDRSSPLGGETTADAPARTLTRFAVGAEAGGAQILANQAAGNAARDAIAAENPGSSIEQTFQTALGARRVDVLTQNGLAIESKVGYTSLSSSIQTQIAKDQLLIENGDVTGVQWVFGRNAVTGQIGPSGPLGAALDKAGNPWSSGP